MTTVHSKNLLFFCTLVHFYKSCSDPNCLDFIPISEEISPILIIFGMLCDLMSTVSKSATGFKIGIPFLTKSGKAG